MGKANTYFNYLKLLLLDAEMFCCYDYPFKNTNLNRSHSIG